MANVAFSDLTKFIKHILRDADLTKLSAKMIRRRCEKEFDVDLTPRKQEVDKIIMSCIDERSDNQKNETTDDSSASESGGSSSEAAENEVVVPDAASEKKVKQLPREKPPPKNIKKSATPKQKKTAIVHSAALDSDDGDDAAVARKLQEEEWNFRRRSAKRMATKKPAAKGKKKDDDDKPKVRKGNSSYTRKCLLSEELAAVVDANEMARHDVVKKMWSIVRERNLFDPSNKQFALCDDQLQKVFGTKRIRMFGMMKYLKHHVKDLK